MRKEIIVNIFRNKDRNIDISLEAINNDIDKINIVKELVICNKDDNEMLGNTNNIEKYFFNYISKDKMNCKIVSRTSIFCFICYCINSISCSTTLISNLFDI